MFNFTEEQKVAALTLGKPLVVTAAAGSGKTTVLVARYLELLKTGLLPHQILTVTFTTDAAEQLRERILKAITSDPSLSELSQAILQNRFIGTIHSFCFYLLSEFGSVLELPPIEEIISDYQFQVRLESGYQNWLNSLSPNNLEEILSWIPRHELRPLFKAFYEHRHHLAPFLTTSHESSPLKTCFLSSYPQIQELEKEMFGRGLFRFDDLEFLSLKLLEKHPSVRRKLQNQFQALLIDEFQDTSQAQWKLFQHLIGQSPQKLFVVGDPKQSIYSFRHADVSLFFEVAALTQNWDGLVTELNTNFRTQSTLISDINRISEGLFRGSSIPFQSMISGRDRVGAPLSVVSYDSLDFEDKKDAELKAVLKTLKERIDCGYSPGDIALLFRMGDRIDLYASKLRACGFFVDCTQTLSLFSHYDVLDLIHYLKALNNPKDTFSLFAFLFSPWVGLPLNTAATLRDEESHIPLEERLKQSYGTDLAWFFSLSKRSYLSIRDALFELCTHSNYFPKQAEAFYEWLKPLCEKHYSVSEALKDIELWKREGILFKAKTNDSERDSIKLMTVHASKGLEFEHVFLVDNLRRLPNFSPTLLISPNNTPGMRYQVGQEKIQCPNYEKLKAQKEQLDTEESRRILYVALTRAKSSLTLFLPKDKKGTPNGSWAQVLDSFQ